MLTSTLSSDLGRREDGPINLAVGIEFCTGVSIIRCQGRITYGPEACFLSEQLSRLVSASDQLILDLDGVVAMDSAGLGELALMVTRAEMAGCSIRVSAPRANIRRLLELTNLSTILEIYPTFNDALEACRQSAW
ncbi:MAG: STAS domain-containing protein [Acidobacteriales bacterium]|nr:STAS domain-containing protein [Terriglobales bacterium]